MMKNFLIFCGASSPSCEATESNSRRYTVALRWGSLLIILLCFAIYSCKAQNEDSTIHNVGSYNAPEIKINDYKMLDYALCKSLSEEEYVKIGTGYIMLGFKIDKKGIVLNVDLLKIKDLIINDLNKSIFILNLKKYVEFNVPTLYHSKDTLSVTILYRKY